MQDQANVTQLQAREPVVKTIGDRWVITLTKDYRFRLIDKEGATDGQHFGSAHDATERAEELQRQHAATHRTRVKVAALDDKGEPLTLTGIHAATGEMLTSPKTEGTVYAPGTKVQAMLREREAARAQIKALDAKLRGYAIVKRGYGRLSDVQHAEAVRLLVKAAMEAKSAADRLDAEG